MSVEMLSCKLFKCGLQQSGLGTKWISGKLRGIEVETRGRAYVNSLND